MLEENPFKKKTFENIIGERKYETIKDFSLPTLHKKQL